MIKINKQGNALKIEFTDNDKYLNEGVMEIAPNELMVVVDSSDMATFKRVANGDVLFSQTIDKIQIAGSAVTKDSILGAFASIGYTSGGGGGGTGAVSSVNGQTGDVVLTADSLGVYTKAEVDTQINGLNDKVTNAVDVAGGAAQLADDVDESLKSHIRDFNSYKEEVRDELAGKQPVGEYATKSELSGEVTSLNESINKKANTDYVDGELAKKADKTQLDAYQLKGDYALKSDLTKYFDNAKYEDKRINFYNGQTVVAWIDATPFIKDGMVTDAKIEDGYLVITFNSDAELEPIKIPITDIFNPDNYYTVTIIDEKLAEKVSNTDFNAYKEEVSSNLDKKLDKSQYETDKETFLTKTEAGQKYQPVGDYVTGEKLNTELSSKADKSELVGLASKADVEEKIDEKLADYYDKTEVDEAIEDAIPDLSDFVTDSELSDYTYDKKTIDEKVAQGGTFDPTNYYDKSDVDGLLKDKADTDSVPTLQQEVKGTEKNYIYSDPTVQGKGAIAAARYRANSNGKLTAQYKYWGDTDFNYNTEFPTATQTADGVMSKEDKIKLDSLTPGGGGTVDAYTKTEADNKFATKSQLNSKAPLPSRYTCYTDDWQGGVFNQDASASNWNFEGGITFSGVNIGDLFTFQDVNKQDIITLPVIGKKDDKGILLFPAYNADITPDNYANQTSSISYFILYFGTSSSTEQVMGEKINLPIPKATTWTITPGSISTLNDKTTASGSFTYKSNDNNKPSFTTAYINIGDIFQFTQSSSTVTYQVIGKNTSGHLLIMNQNGCLIAINVSSKTWSKVVSSDYNVGDSVVIGQLAQGGNYSVVIGYYAAAEDAMYGTPTNYGVAIGYQAKAQGEYSTAVGVQATAKDATVIGSNLQNSNGEKVVIGHNYNTYFDVDSSEVARVREGGVMKQIATKSDITGKQDTLKSGTNIKTINGESILGSGNIEISGGGGAEYEQLYQGNSLTPEQIASNKVIIDRLEAGETIPLYWIENDVNKYIVSRIQRQYSSSAEYYTFYSVYWANEGKQDITNLQISINSTGTFRVRSYNSTNPIKTASGYLDVATATRNITAKQVDLESVTAKGEGLADAYDVKQYVDSHSGGGGSSPKIWNATCSNFNTMSSNYIKFEDTSATFADIKVGDILHIDSNNGLYIYDLQVASISNEMFRYTVNLYYPSGPSIGFYFAYSTAQDNLGNINLYTREYLTQGSADSRYIKNDGLKTINGESIIGEGNIEIDTSVEIGNGLKKDEQTIVVDTDIIATKEYVDAKLGDINSILTAINGE